MGPWSNTNWPAPRPCFHQGPDEAFRTTSARSSKHWSRRANACLNQLVFDADATASYHPGGVNFLFGDGSVHMISNGINGLVYEALLTRAGGEVASGGDY
jgi:prepilin-type processing-associated H-X9-DG protein